MYRKKNKSVLLGGLSLCLNSSSYCCPASSVHKALWDTSKTLLVSFSSIVKDKTFAEKIKIRGSYLREKKNKVLPSGRVPKRTILDLVDYFWAVLLILYFTLHFTNVCYDLSKLVLQFQCLSFSTNRGAILQIPWANVSVSVSRKDH